MNIVIFIGEISEAPYIRESAMGNKFALMKVRIPRPFSNSEGVYESDEVVVTLWKGIAQTAAEVADVGDSVAIKGRLQSRSFEGKDGNIHLAYDVIAERVSFIGKHTHAG